MKTSVQQDVARRILEREEWRKAAGVKTCKTCHGAGFIIAKPHTKTCPDCKGTGKAP